MIQKKSVQPFLIHKDTGGFGVLLGQPLDMHRAVDMQITLMYSQVPHKSCISRLDSSFANETVSAAGYASALANLKIHVRFNPSVCFKCVSGIAQKLSPEQQVTFCKNRLACGACSDDFMRKTLGVILFPDFYSLPSIKQR